MSLLSKLFRREVDLTAKELGRYMAEGYSIQKIAKEKDVPAKLVVKKVLDILDKDDGDIVREMIYHRSVLDEMDGHRYIYDQQLDDEELMTFLAITVHGYNPLTSLSKKEEEE